MANYTTIKLPTTPIELAVSKDDTRYMLTNPSYNPRSGKWFASDTWILSTWQGDCSDDILTDGEAISIPADAITFIRKQYLKKATPFLLVENNGKSVRCPITHRIWQTIEGRVPDFERVNRRDNEGKQVVSMGINPQLLLQLAKSMNAGAYKKSNAIKLEFTFDPHTGEVEAPLAAIDTASGRQGTIMPVKV